MTRKQHAARNNQKISDMTRAGRTAEQISLALGISIRTVRRRRADLGLKWTWRVVAAPKREICPKAITAKPNTPACGGKTIYVFVKALQRWRWPHDPRTWRLAMVEIKQFKICIRNARCSSRIGCELSVAL